MSNENDNRKTNAGSDDKLDFVVPLPRPNPFKPSDSPTTVGMSVSDVASNVSEFLNSDTVANAKKVYDIINAVRKGDYAKAAEELGGADAAQLVNDLGEAANVINVIKEKVDNIGGGPVGPSGLPTSSASYHDNQTILSLAPHPTEVRLNTGLKPYTFTQEYNKAVVGYRSPLHFNVGKISFPAADQTDAGKFYDSGVMFTLKTKITENITYSPNSTLVDPAMLRQAINAMIKALSIYYSVSRYYVYGNMLSNNKQIPFNENEAINYLANLASDGNVVRSFLKLKRMLNVIPIPPNLNTLIFYLHQFFQTSDEPGSVVLGITPCDFTAGVPNLQTELEAGVTALSTYTDVYALISRAIPTWRTTPLLTSHGNFLHDDQFTTFWVNMPFELTGTNGSAYTLKGPSVADNNTAVVYNSYSNNLDGGIFGLMNMYNTTTSSWIPGLFSPLAVPDVSGGSNKSSRLSWFYVGSTVGFYDSFFRGTSIMRDDTYTTTSMNSLNTPMTGLNIGAEACEGVTANVVTEAAMKLLDWCLSWETVPMLVNTKLKPSNSNNNPYTGRPTKGGNPKKGNKFDKKKHK